MFDAAACIGHDLIRPSAEARWLTLTNALSGLFCASLNFIDSTKTIRPLSTFEPEGTRNSSQKLHLLHGALPHEVVCTENLTPFLKLLPCKAKAGISSLLDGHKLFDASWQTMAIDVRPICPEDGSECVVEIEQTVDMVLDIERSTRPASMSVFSCPPMLGLTNNQTTRYLGLRPSRALPATRPSRTALPTLASPWPRPEPCHGVSRPSLADQYEAHAH